MSVANEQNHNLFIQPYSHNNMKLILMGPPGSGKGTMSERLEKDYNLPHISAGELLREEVAKGTTIGKDIKVIMDKGDLVPAKLMAEMIKLTVKDEENYMFDGFPRSLDQAKYIEDLHIDAVIYLEVPEDVVIARFAGRRMCKANNHGYHIENLPPKVEGVCDKCEGELYQRDDDKPEAIKARLKVYEDQTSPLIGYYKEKGLLIEVDANSEDIDGIVKNLNAKLDDIKQKSD